MAAPRPTLRAFLQSAWSALASASPTRPPLSFVVGNEAADLDSLCSAIVLAYVRTHQSPPPAPQTLHVPVANIPRADFSLRPEFAGVLRHVGLTTGDMPSLSEIFADSDAGTLVPGLAGTEKQGGPRTRWLLVDHNVLTGPLANSFSRRVVGCLDHHIDEGVVPTDCGREPRVVDVVGSCATLVCEYARGEWERAMERRNDNDDNDDDDDGNDNGNDNDVDNNEEIDGQLARLALAPILVDTAGFANPHKTTARDVAIGEFLEATLLRPRQLGEGGGSDDGTGYCRQAYLDELRGLESNFDGMSVRDILRKDYKEWRESGCAVGVSAVVQPLGDIVSRASCAGAYLDAVRAWAGERGLDLVAVMTITTPPGGLRRELFVWGITERGVRSAREFERRSGGWLELSVWGEGGLDGEHADGEHADGEHVDGEHVDGEHVDGWRRAWKQANLSQSRKQVGPLLREAARAAGQ